MIVPLMISQFICTSAKRNKKDKDFDSYTPDPSLFYETENSKNILYKLQCVCEFISCVQENAYGDIKINYLRNNKNISTIVNCHQLHKAKFDIIHNVVKLMSQQYLFEEKK